MFKNLFYTVVLFFTIQINGHEKLITGIVTDSTGGLPGVSILIKGTTKGTETDFEGKYTIKANLGDILTFSYIGYKTQEKIVGSSFFINVKMIEGGELLDEIVITGLGFRKEKKSLGYAVSDALLSKTSGVILRGTSSIKGKAKQFKPQSGQLTAGELNDLEKWEEWLTLTKNNTDYLNVKKNWKVDIENKIKITVFDNADKPINNAIVFLIDNDNKIIDKVRTDVFGKAVVFKNSNRKSDYYILQVLFERQVKGFRITNSYDNLHFVFDTNTISKDIDIMFTIDATGSMGDEINYLKSEIENIINRVNKSVVNKRIGLVFYRDKGDAYLTRSFDFTTNIVKVKEDLSKQYAGGGGDYEEAVEEALKVSLNMSWNSNSRSKLLFLLLDAPPHLNEKNILIIKNQIKKAKEKGIKIIPIVSSGSDKTVEFLMRYFSISTNGTYVFLTDDSGIGNTHLKPSTDTFKLEKLNNLIVRLIEKYAGV